MRVEHCLSAWSFPLTPACPRQYTYSSLWRCVSDIVYLLGHFPWLQHVQDRTSTVVFEAACRTLSLVVSLTPACPRQPTYSSLWRCVKQCPWSFPLTPVYPRQSLKVCVEQCPWLFPLTPACPRQYTYTSLWRCESNIVLGHFPWLQRVQDRTPTVVFEGASQTLLHASLVFPLHFL